MSSFYCLITYIPDQYERNGAKHICGEQFTEVVYQMWETAGCMPSVC